MKRKFFLLALPLAAAGAFLLQGNANSAEQSDLRILKFEADWCGPCQQMKPIFEKVSKSLSSKASFQTINVDKQPGLADRYKVSVLPTVIAVKGGKEVDRTTGYMNNLRLKGFVQKNL
ncbi:MAG: thioredoxin family protein [Verrucomicrobiales bacterium]|nr:thioredoxin family protein [Verrucomicrobiales bacterium]